MMIPVALGGWSKQRFMAEDTELQHLLMEGGGG